MVDRQITLCTAPRGGHKLMYCDIFLRVCVLGGVRFEVTCAPLLALCHTLSL